MEKNTYNADRKPTSIAGFFEKHLPTFYNLFSSNESEPQSSRGENKLENKKETANLILNEIKKSNPKNGYNQYTKENELCDKYIESYKHLCLFFDEAATLNFELNAQDIHIVTHITDMFYQDTNYSKSGYYNNSRSEINHETIADADNRIKDSKLNQAVLQNISKIRESGNKYYTTRAHNYLNTLNDYIIDLEKRWKSH